MKKLIPVLFLTMLSGITYGQHAKTATIEITTSIACDHCLRCESCAPRLQRAIRANGGIKSVNIDPTKNVITVKYKTSKTSAEQIKEAIAKVGFAADDQKAIVEAYDKLDACCKKPATTPRVH